jgi:energy-coupling factor transport system ATP-binding protein
MLRASHVEYSWKDREVSTSAVRDFCGEFAAGVPHVICGPSGSGKTTLSLLLGGLLQPDHGEVSWNNELLGKSAIRSAYAFQFPERLFFEDTMHDEITGWTMSGLQADTGIFDRLGIPWDKIGHSHPRQLSAGIGRLAAIALQLARQPDLLILDEPTVGLDWVLQQRLLNVLRDWINPRRVLIVVTHDLETMAELGGQAWVMSEGRLAQVSSCAELLTQPDVLRTYGLDP